jgi:transcriptional regulator with XRE-family HTH domain
MDAQHSPPEPGPFAVEMRMRRDHLNLSVAAAARAAGISALWWRRLEAGYEPDPDKGYVPSKPSIVTAVKIARALGMDERSTLDLAGFEGCDIPDVPEPTDVELIAQLPPKQRDEVMRFARFVASGAVPQTS